MCPRWRHGGGEAREQGEHVHLDRVGGVAKRRLEVSYGGTLGGFRASREGLRRAKLARSPATHTVVGQE